MFLLVVLASCKDPYAYAPTCDGPTAAWRSDPPTWSADIQPLIAENCLACHVAGGLGPVSFETWEETASWAPVIAAVTADRTMPPFPPTTCGECGTFADSLALSDDDIAMLAAWAEAEAPQGDPTAPPVPPVVLRTLPRVDATLSLPAPYTPDADVTDDYRCFLVEAGRAETGFLTGFEVVPGDPAEVHHASVAAIENESSVGEARALDAQDSAPGWSCFGGFGFAGARTVAGYLPGSGAKIFPEGTGIELVGGRPMAIQIHYNTLNGVSPDDTVVRLMLEDQVPMPAQMEKYLERNFELPPGEASTSLVSETRAPGARLIWGLAPHEHALGTTIRAELVHEDGTTDCLIDVPNWDFHWQGFFFYEEPVRMRATDIFRVYCEWSTLGVDDPVRYGESTTDEMCTVHTYATIE